MKKNTQPRQILVNLRNIRKARGLSINNLAEKVGTDYQQIGRIERGQTQLTVDLLYKLSQVLETPVSNLLEESAPNINDEVRSAEGKENNLTLLIPEIFKELEDLCKKNNVAIAPADLAQLSTIIYTYVSKINCTDLNAYQQLLKVFFQAFDAIFEKLVLTKVH